MSVKLTEKHFREYHARRFEKEIKRDRKKADFRDSSLISRESAQTKRHKKIIGRKMRNVLQKEKRSIQNYHTKLSTNLKKNTKILKTLSTTTNNQEIWKRRLNLIKHTRNMLKQK